MPKASAPDKAPTEEQNSEASKTSEARGEAERALQGLGFVRSGIEWTGGLRIDQGTSVDVWVSLPERFPDVLPEIKVDRKALPKRVAHVEKSGKICIAPSSGVLIDADRPADLVVESLQLAEGVLKRGLSGESDEDLQREFLAYWESTDQVTTYSLCRADGGFRELTVSRVTGGGFLKSGPLVLADKKGDVEHWAQNLGAKYILVGKAAFLPFQTSFDPPEFGVQTTVGELRELFRKHVSSKDFGLFERWLESTRFPTTVLLSLPEPSRDTGRVLVGIRIEKPAKDIEKELLKGFRPGHVPASRILGFVRNASAARLDLTRLDRRYLGVRGGATHGLAEKRVVLVGAGAVGSEIAGMLGAAGVGELRIIDPDTLTQDNVHRHALGVRNLHSDKALALAARLRHRFPHLTFEGRKGRIEELLVKDPRFIRETELIILAIADDTLERRLNRSLVGPPPRIHSWVEPLGVGGHALATVTAGPGCFECLFQYDDRLGLVNKACFVAPGQIIERSLAGCAGTFSPFSAFDAHRTALETAALAVAILTGEQKENALVSWRGDRTEFESAGYRLSERGSRIKHGGRDVLTGRTFSSQECKVCGHRQP